MQDVINYQSAMQIISNILKALLEMPDMVLPMYVNVFARNAYWGVEGGGGHRFKVPTSFSLTCKL